MGHMSISDKTWAILAFIYILVFEVLYLIYADFFSSFGILIKLFKVLFPFIFFSVVFFKYGITIVSNNVLRNYIFFFSLLFILGFVSSSVSSTDSVVVWLKYLPRYLFFLSMAIFFIKKPNAVNFVLKGIIFLSLATALQYGIMEIFRLYNIQFLYPFGSAVGAGPYGLFGNITANHFFHNSPFHLYRLSGFWTEPTGASAFLFASFFLSRYLLLVEKKKYWNSIGYLCLVGGFMTFSMAGYCALGVALSIGALLYGVHKKALFKKIGLFAVGLCLIFFALFGRTYVARYLPNVELARLIGGPPDSSLVAVDLNYAIGGRIGNIQSTHNIVSDNPIGIGFYDQLSFKMLGNQSGAAPLVWYLFTGLPGVILLFLREIWLWIKIKRGAISPKILFLGQAYSVVAVQQLSVGDWMSPFYFVLAAAIFAAPQYLNPENL